MNYLAHFYLADPDQELMFGNYIGDGVKGSDLKRFSEPVARGVRFHRFIDTYTDQHPEVLAAKELFYPTQRKFSGVVVDVLFDHLLARKWDAYHEATLPAFASRCYEVVASMQEDLPHRSERFYQYMLANDLLTHYATREGIEKVLSGMDYRTKFTSNMVDAMNATPETFEQLSIHFERFFPDLVEACQKWKSDH